MSLPLACSACWEDCVTALGGWPLPHSSSLSYLFRSLPSCTSEHNMLSWHNVASVSSFVYYAVILHIFSVSNFSSDTSHLTETKKWLHYSSLQCCFLLCIKLYVCFAQSANNSVLIRSYQVGTFIFLVLIAVLFYNSVIAVLLYIDLIFSLNLSLLVFSI